jgi:3-oxoadipate enol-lactonase
MQAEINGIQLHYQLDGRDGAPWLTFSNSLFTNLSLWDDQVAALQDDFRILRYDHRGHGQTSATPGRYTLGLLAADLAGLLDQVGVERTHYVGISMGSSTGLALAARQPERFLSFALCDSRPFSPPTFREYWGALMQTVERDGIAALIEPTIERWFGAEFRADPAAVARIRAMMQATSADGYVGCAAALQDYDVRPGLARLGCPVLRLAGATDGTTPALLSELQAELPGSTYACLEGAGHISNLEQPAAFTEALVGFLNHERAAR